MDREIVHTLLCLLDQRVAIEFPGEIFRFAADFFERLVDRHGANGDGGIADDPFARFMNVFAGREIHDGVGAPPGRPNHFLDLFLD